MNTSMMDIIRGSNFSSSFHGGNDGSMKFGSYRGGRFSEGGGGGESGGASFQGRGGSNFSGEGGFTGRGWRGFEGSFDRGRENEIGQLNERGMGQFNERGMGQSMERGMGQSMERGMSQLNERGMGQFNERGMGQFNERGMGQFNERGMGQFNERGMGQFSERGMGQSMESVVSQFNERGMGQLNERGVGQFNEGRGDYEERIGRYDQRGENYNSGYRGEREENCNTGYVGERGPFDSERNRYGGGQSRFEDEGGNYQDRGMSREFEMRGGFQMEGRGGLNSARDEFEDRRNFEPERIGNYDNRRGFEPEREFERGGGFDNKRSYEPESGGEYDDRRGFNESWRTGSGHSQDGFDNRWRSIGDNAGRGGFNNEDGDFGYKADSHQDRREGWNQQSSRPPLLNDGGRGAFRGQGGSFGGPFPPRIPDAGFTTEDMRRSFGGPPFKRTMKNEDGYNPPSDYDSGFIPNSYNRAERFDSRGRGRSRGNRGKSAYEYKNAGKEKPKKTVQQNHAPPFQGKRTKDERLKRTLWRKRNRLLRAQERLRPTQHILRERIARELKENEAELEVVTARVKQMLEDRAVAKLLYGDQNEKKEDSQKPET